MSNSFQMEIAKPKEIEFNLN